MPQHRPQQFRSTEGRQLLPRIAEVLSGRTNVVAWVLPGVTWCVYCYLVSGRKIGKHPRYYLSAGR